MSSPRFRLRFTFWLDMLKKEEANIADTIELMKNERSFSSAIRDGLRLIWDLRQGKLEVLFELFPWVRAEFMEYLAEANRSAEGAALPAPSDAAHVSDLQEQLDRIEQALMGKGGAAPKMGLGNAIPLAVPQFAAPVFDDGDDALPVVQTDTQSNANQNLVAALLRLQE